MGWTNETLVLRVTEEETGRGKIQKVYLPDFLVYFKVPFIGAIWSISNFLS